MYCVHVRDCILLLVKVLNKSSTLVKMTIDVILNVENCIIIVKILCYACVYSRKTSNDLRFK